MKKSLRSVLWMGSLALVLFFCARSLRAQDEPAAQGNPPPPPAQGEATQGAPPPPPPGQADGAQGRGMRFDPARMQERMLERMKDQLAPTDEEWSVIKPLLTDVAKQQMDMQRGRFGRMGMMGRMGGRMGRPGGPGGQGGPGADGQQGPPQGPPPGMMGPEDPATTSLTTALDTEGTTNKELKEKLETYRAAQKKKEAALKESRDKLRKVLTLRQEARLTLMGFLD